MMHSISRLGKGRLTKLPGKERLRSSPRGYNPQGHNPLQRVTIPHMRGTYPSRVELPGFYGNRAQSEGTQP